jgi:hypothetical protein
VIAYDARTGAELWVTSHGSDTEEEDAIAGSADSSAIYVAGRDDPTNPGFLVVRLSASSGIIQWTSHYDTGDGSLPAAAPSPDGLALSPDNSKVFITGAASTPANPDVAVTVAFDSNSGGQLWHAFDPTYASSAGRCSGYTAVPASATLFVLEDCLNLAGIYPTLLAYDAATGSLTWRRTFPTTVPWPYAVALDTNNSSVVVGGWTFSYDFWGTAISTVDGSSIWDSSWPHVGVGDGVQRVDVGPSGTVYLSGTSGGETDTSHEFAVVAFNP